MILRGILREMTSCKALTLTDLAVLSAVRQDTSRLGPFTRTISNRATMSSGGKRIVFTGGSGKAGRHVIPELLKKGHQVSAASRVGYKVLT